MFGSLILTLRVQNNAGCTMLLLRSVLTSCKLRSWWIPTNMELNNMRACRNPWTIGKGEDVELHYFINCWILCWFLCQLLGHCLCQWFFLMLIVNHVQPGAHRFLPRIWLVANEWFIMFSSPAIKSSFDMQQTPRHLKCEPSVWKSYKLERWWRLLGRNSSGMRGCMSLS